MKKLMYLFAAFTFFLITSCGGNAGDATTEEAATEEAATEEVVNEDATDEATDSVDHDHSHEGGDHDHDHSHEGEDHDHSH